MTTGESGGVTCWPQWQNAVPAASNGRVVVDMREGRKGEGEGGVYGVYVV